MNLPPPGLVGDQLIAQQQPILQQPSFPIQNHDTRYGSYQLPLQLSQYYNVLPSTKTSWSFPNGCVTSNIVRFTGLPTPTYPIGSTIPSCHLSGGVTPVKRKSLPLENEGQPSKIFVTEDKMAARMNDMHISSEFVSFNDSASAALVSSEMDEELPEAPEITLKPKLVVCDELKNLRELDPIIPASLVLPVKSDKSTALMVWRPLNSYANTDNDEDGEVDLLPRSSVIITDVTDRPDLDNNNITTVNLNTLMVPPHIEYPPESMDE